MKQRQRLELNQLPATDQEKLKEFKDQRPQISPIKTGVNNERNPRALRDVLFSDFGVSYKEVSELGKLIYSSTKPNCLEEQVLRSKTNKNVNANVLEFWLNETLGEAQLQDLPTGIKKAPASSSSSKRSVCIDLGIDRLTLLATGISNEGIDKLYRCLFATTVGFYHQIQEVVEQQSDAAKLRAGNQPGRGGGAGAPEADAGQKRHSTKASILTALWRVLAMLLEHTYTTE